MPEERGGSSSGDSWSDWSMLMARAQLGDRAAYELLLIELHPYLRRVTSRYFRCEADSKDCVQDILLSIHLARRSYDPTRPLGPWLLTVARRRIHDRLRQYMRKTRTEASMRIQNETFQPDPTNSYTALDRYSLGRAIEALPKTQRRAIELLKVRGLSLKEAAAESGTTVGALKIAVHRAMRALRHALT